MISANNNLLLFAFSSGLMHGYTGRSASAFFVTQTLRGLSRDGRTVIASIHQPSSEVFELFDRLYLLSGGKTVYFGQASEAYEVINSKTLSTLLLPFLFLFHYLCNYIFLK